MKVLDLFSGTGGWSQAFLDAGHEVTRIENDEQFIDVPCTNLSDVMGFRDMVKALAEIKVELQFDVVLASPPCQGFSVAALGHNWEVSWLCRCGGTVTRKGKHRGGSGKNLCTGCDSPRRKNNAPMSYEPVSHKAREGLRLVNTTLEIINLVKPKYWWMENPRSGLRKMSIVEGLPRTTITYCQYGENRMKPTDLWGAWPKSWIARQSCKRGSPCHEAAPRGSTKGTRGLANAKERAIIPFELSEEVRIACEKAV